MMQDLRFSFRMLVQNPGLTAVALLSLGLGIGANTTIFSVVNAILVRPLPLKEPERVVVLGERNLQQPGWRNPTFAAFQEWKKQTQVFEHMALAQIGIEPATLTGAGQAVRVMTSSVNADFFSLAGVAPALGRTLLPEDSPPGEGKAILLSHNFWQRHFNGDTSVIGRTLSVEGMKVTIIGVMPPGFWLVPWAKDNDLWWPHNPAGRPQARWLTAIGRLKHGVTLERARAEMDTLFRRFAQERPDIYKGWGIEVEPLQEWAVGNMRKALYLLLGTVSFVLLVACANVANLLLARASARQKEIAVRASLGAGRLRLIRQLLTESMVLALLGGLLGVFVAMWGIDVFVLLAPQWFPGVTEISIDTTVLGFTLALSLLTGLLFGLAPAVQASRPDLNESLKEAGGRSTGGSGNRARGLLVVSEVALALILLMGAGLMINSFLRLHNVDLGFDRENTLTAEIFLAGPEYWSNLKGDMKRVTPQGDVFFEQLLERIRQLPGVVSASIGSLERMISNPVRIPGRPLEDVRGPLRPLFAEVSPGFFETMGIPLLKGRALSERDVQAAPWVVVVSESFARRFFPDEDPIGKVLYLTVSSFGANHDVEEGRPREIVGVVRDVRYWGPGNEAPVVIYGSYRQHPWDYPGGSYSFHLMTKVIIRTAGDPMSVAAPLQRIVAELDKDQVVYDIMTMEQRVVDFVSYLRFFMRLFGIFAGLAVFLAVVGIYGVMSYSVSRRTHEIGVRMANGAGRRDVLRLVVGQGLKLALIGVAIGMAGALALTRLLEQFLYEVKPGDPLTLVIVAVALTAVALGAAYIPARRAAKVDPIVALRYE